MICAITNAMVFPLLLNPTSGAQKTGLKSDIKKLKLLGIIFITKLFS